MLNKTFRMGALALTLAGVSGVANAAVDFDPSTGYGFVGKGDVQFVFGWNNAQLQSNAEALAFSYVQSTQYDVTCEWTTGPERNRKTHSVTQSTNVSVNGDVMYDARRQQQVTGFDLMGFEEDINSESTTPKVGAPCPNGNAGTIIEVLQLSEDSLPGGLYVTFGTTRHLLQMY